MKMNVIKIILLTIIALLLSGILFVLLTKYKFDYIKFGGSEKLLKEESYDINKKKIIVNTYAAEVEIKESKDELIHIELYGEKETDYIIEENDNLKIEDKSKHNICIGFCFTNRHIVVYLPKDYISELELKTISGDVTSEIDFVNKATIDTTSGDVKLKGNEEININTVSGDIEMENATKIDLGTTSGDIKIDSLNLESDSSINTISGCIKISETNDIYIDTHTVSGDVKIEHNNRHADIDLKINTTSGDIRIKN